MVARQAHNLEVACSSPASATNNDITSCKNNELCRFFGFRVRQNRDKIGRLLFVFDMGKPVKIVDLAKRMISLSGAKNIEIKFSGLREGEKLYEELLSTKENTIPTNNPKIMVAKVREYDYEEAKKNEDELLRISYTHDDMAIVKKMKEIVPEYKSQVSKYEVLDKKSPPNSLMHGRSRALFSEKNNGQVLPLTICKSVRGSTCPFWVYLRCGRLAVTP